MLSTDDIRLNISLFAKNKEQKVLLLHGKSISSLIDELLSYVKSTNLPCYYFDLSQSSSIENTLVTLPAEQVSLFVINVNELENPFIRYQLDRWKCKVIIICDKSLLHPLLDPAIYFAPIAGNKVQRRFFTKAEIKRVSIEAPKQDIKSKELPLVISEKKSEQPNNMFDHFLAKKLMVNDPAIMQLLADRVLVDESYKDFLFKLVYASRTNEKMRMAAANAITILIRAKVPLSGMDLSNINISYANLTNAIMDGANLQNSNLSHVNVDGAWLRYADFMGAIMDNIDFGWPYFPLLREITSSCRMTAVSCCYSHDGRLLAVADGENIQLFDTRTRTLVNTLKGHTNTVTSISFSTSEDKVVTGSYDKTIRLWALESGICEKIFEGHTESVTSVVYLPDELHLISGSWDKTIKLWSIEDCSCLETYTDQIESVYCLAYSSSRNLLASGHKDNTVRLWSILPFVCIRTFEGHTDLVNGVAFNPAGQLLVSGSWDMTLRLWSIATGNCERIFKGHKASVRCVAFNPNGEQIASSSGGYHSKDDTVRLWSVVTGECEKVLEGHSAPVWSVAYSPDGKQLASCSQDNSTHLWSSSVSNAQTAKGQEYHSHAVIAVAIDGNGEYLASGSRDTTIGLWSTKRGDCLKVLRGHNEEVQCVTFNLTGELLASGSGAPAPLMNKTPDNSIRIWSVKDGACKQILEGHEAAVNTIDFSQDGKLLASGGGYQYANDESYNTVKIWSLSNGVCKLTLRGHSTPVRKVAFSPNGKVLASESDDNIIVIWSTASGEGINVFLDRNFPSEGSIFKDNQTLVFENPYDRSEQKVKKKRAIQSLNNLPMVHHGFWFTNKKSSERFLATGHSDAAVRYWRVKDSRLELVWSSKQSHLNVEGANFHNTKGLSQVNIELLIQQSAIFENPVETNLQLENKNIGFKADSEARSPNMT